MKALNDGIPIHAPPARIFGVLRKVFSTSEDYQSWHKDHVSCRWLQGAPFEKGSSFVAEEYLHGKLHKLRCKVTHVSINKIEYRFRFPTSIICPKGSFEVLVEDRQSLFIATLYFRFANFFERYARQYVEMIKNHMKEEGVQLRRMVEEIE